MELKSPMGNNNNSYYWDCDWTLLWGEDIHEQDLGQDLDSDEYELIDDNSISIIMMVLIQLLFRCKQCLHPKRRLLEISNT